MNYTSTQLGTAKRNYNSFIQFTTAKSDVNYSVNPFEAERRAEDHNSLVSAINSGDVELEKKWKLFFLREVALSEQKSNESKAKLAANKEASADILAQIKSAKRIGEFGKWLNTAGNPFRKEHFNKKYTKESVNAFLSI